MRLLGSVFHSVLLMAYTDKNPTHDADVVEIRESYEYDTNNWQDIRAEAKIDMQYVSGNPWDEDDKKRRKNRPTVAPEEMSQYRNQVINALMANPRGGKFAPVGNGANDKTAEFYQNKWREIEYRSHATHAYNLAADNALQRSYGFVKVSYDYASPRERNMEIKIEGFPNPDMVLPDSDALMYDSSDMKRCFVYRWMPQKEFTREHPKAKIKNFADVAGTFPNFVQGNKILLAEAWRIQTRPRKLLLIQPHPQAPGQPAPPPMQLFQDEILKLPPGTFTVVRELRSVDYPDVKMSLTNGLEVLSEHNWLGKYIPIVSCYGKVLFIDGDQGMERKILSMTRFGRDPWKSYCYACSQELEVLAQVPKASLFVPRGSMNVNELRALEESYYQPKPYLTYQDIDEQGRQRNPPNHAEYMQGTYLQGIELVKEGFRRAIQSAMGSNFLPTQAQRHNEKSGRALDKIDQVAAQGTYHFVYAYDGLIRQTAVIGEDLMDKIYDFKGKVGVMAADGKASQVDINDPQNKDAYSTSGDHVVTVSTAPSSDSQREAANDFTQSLVSNIQIVAGIAGPKIASAVFAKSIRMLNLGPQGDSLADLMEPPEFKQKEGEPPSPELMAAKAQIEHLTQELQRAGKVIETKQIEQSGKLQITREQLQATSADKAADREVKLAVAALGAKVERLALLIEESKLVGARAHEADQAAHDRAHETIELAKDRAHERLSADASHEHALEQGDQATAGAMATQEQAAALAPEPEAGA